MRGWRGTGEVLRLLPAEFTPLAWGLGCTTWCLGLEGETGEEIVMRLCARSMFS